MEELDINNELNIFCLHYVFLPKINASLQSFKEAWNGHPMQSESGLSPEQLWIQGMALYEGQSMAQVDLPHHGIDWNAPMSTDNDVEAVEIPATQNPLSLSDFAQLQETIDPFLPSDDHGICQYLMTVHFVESKVV
jgi:hypothetical protein